MRPSFFWRRPDAVLVSASISALLDAGAPPTLDDRAMAVFVRTGFFVGDDTPFASIRAVPPAAVVDWGSGGPSLRSTWRHPPRARMSRDEAIDRFIDAVTRSVETSLNASDDPPAVPLTGGPASRHLLLAMDELQRRPSRVVTVVPYPPDSPDDLSVARLLASALGIRHVILPPRPDRIAAEREKNELTHYCDEEHAQILPLRDHFTRHRCTVFDGVAGDVLTQSDWLSPELHQLFLDGDFDGVADRVLGNTGGRDRAIRGLLTAGAAARFSREAAKARVAAEASQYADAANPIASFFFFTQMRRQAALAPFALLDVSPVTAPYLDADVVELLLSLPFELTADRQFHTDAIHRRYPTFAHVRFAGKRHGVDDRRLTRHQAASLLRVVARMRSTLVNGPQVLARTARAVLTGSSSHLWFLSRVIHLLDVERRADAGVSEPLPLGAPTSLRAV